MQTRQTFKKQERLCNKKLIAALFNSGKWFFEYPFKLTYLYIDDHSMFNHAYPAQVLFTIPKRKFKRAVDRNHLKRLLREGYRKNKWMLYETLNAHNERLILGFIYTGKQEVDYHELEKKIIHALERLQQQIKDSSN